jgi:formamidopyrimidine-DNA glycosylase
MPELPEVETIRRQLSERIPGRTVTRFHVLDPRLTAPDDPEVVAADVVGQRIARVDRRGKYLLIRLSGGDTLAAHLRMTGRLHWQAGPPAEGERFVRAVIDLDDGATLTFGDQRRFGRAWIIPAGTDETDYWRGRVGLEPLTKAFTADELGRLMGGRRIVIKAALLNQALVAGIGNMYADEALFQAGVHPERPAGSLSRSEHVRLHRAVRDRLRAAIDAGGASIDTYRDGLGNKGEMQNLLRVHLHAGEPCPRCRQLIRKTRVAQRGTYWCPRCQPRFGGSA